MSGARPQMAFSTARGMIGGRSSLAHLLHALNQPLTGLQCSMELALAGPRPADHYIRTLSEGLDLVARMRLLVEALRELAELQVPAASGRLVILLDNLLLEAAHELAPVAEASKVRLVATNSAPLPVRGHRGPLLTLLFRTMECMISMGRVESEFRIAATSDGSNAIVGFSWIPGPAPEHSPFSPPELGLLVAREAWQRLGTCSESQAGDRQSWTIRIPMAWPSQHDSRLHGEGK